MIDSNASALLPWCFANRRASSFMSNRVAVRTGDQRWAPSESTD